jgi:hypothetical protein
MYAITALDRLRSANVNWTLNFRLRSGVRRWTVDAPRSHYEMDGDSYRLKQSGSERPRRVGFQKGRLVGSCLRFCPDRVETFTPLYCRSPFSGT